MSDWIALDSSAQGVMLQFSFSNPKVVPKTVHWMGKETYSELMERIREPSGQLVLGPALNCSLQGFVDWLLAEQDVVTAKYQERLHPDDTTGSRTRHMVRFVLLKNGPSDQLGEEVYQKRALWAEELRKMCTEALWSVRVFLNPTRVPGEYYLSVNLGVRTPLVHPDGCPVVTRKRVDGRKTGKPVPITPEYRLDVVDRRVELTKPGDGV